MRIFLPALFTLGLLLGQASARADQNDPRLDGLFAQLQEDIDPQQAHVLQGMIWSIWHQSTSATVNLLMRRGVESMGQGDFATALDAFSTIIDIEPDFAEGWNKRATLFFLMGRYEDSISDVHRTLDLEPRHFGALSGLGMIYNALEDDEKALDAWEQALAVDPHLGQAQAEVKRLRSKVRGDKI